MDKVLLGYLIRLFAIIANIFPHLLLENVSGFIKSFLLKEFSPDLVEEYLALFRDYYKRFAANRDPGGDSGYLHVKLVRTIKEINNDIPKKQKFQILVRLLFFEKFFLKYALEPGKDQLSFEEVLKLVVEYFRIESNEFNNCKHFISDSLYDVPEKNKLLIVGPEKGFMPDINFLQHKNLKGQLFFLHIESASLLLFFYEGSSKLSLNNKPIFPNQVYIFNKGFSIKGSEIDTLYYKQLLQVFLSYSEVNLSLQVHDVEFRFKNSDNGIQLLNLNIRQGQLIAMMGRSGAGKSTLLNILNGSIKPQKGTISINGYDLYKQDRKLEGIIGYVPQDDLLIEDLSVFRNLYINAQLCYNDLSPEQLTEKVNNLLAELNLYEAKDLKVGSPLNKFISGGQRKKLNMALELIREPWILFADEPTSGLSSSDSEEIMNHLAEQTLKGCIVFVNIHQPSSDIFKLFDKILVLDKGGHPAYFGNPVESISYFNLHGQHLTTTSEICNVCENINPETIFKVLEEKKVNEFGEYTGDRKFTPQDWHNRYKENTTVPESVETTMLPKSELKKPGVFKQFKIFSKRNILAKLANKPYMLLALGISPFLSVLLAYLCRSGLMPGTSLYSFGYNPNIPSYFFMCVLVALFVGLIISAEEIIKDRKILFRESFLKLSKASYIHSKVLYLLALSALQTFLFVVIGNSILDIEGMTLNFWVILFATSCFANMLGLLISSVFNSVVVIYITVPLVMVPLILLSGVVVDFDRLNEKVSSKDVVPITGDVMASRWAYEALLVSQFEYNGFEKNFFEADKTINNLKFDRFIVIKETEKTLDELKNNNNKNGYKDQVEFIHNELNYLNNNYDFKGCPDIPKDAMTNKDFDKISDYLVNLSRYLLKTQNYFENCKENATDSLIRKMGGTDKLFEFKSLNYNNSVAEMLLKTNSFQEFKRDKNRIIRVIEPVYKIPVSKSGKAHFLSSVKRIGDYQVNTLVFNTIVIWMMTVILYLSIVVYFYYLMKL
jgi:ABC transport system ATP-binding/permease protein